MVKNVPFVNHGACLHVMNESLQSWLPISAIICTSMNQPRVARPSKQDITFYTRQFASVIVEALYAQKWFQHVPDLSTSSALVTLNLTKSQRSKDEKAIKAIKAEAEGLRANGTWEMIKDQFNQHIFFTEAKTAMLAALNLTLWFGCMTTISCADCIQAYLQCLLERNTWAILPFELGLEEWKKIYEPFTRLAIKLIKSLYDVVWSPTIRKVVASPSRKAVNQLTEMKRVPLESYPSNFVFRRGKNDEHTLILNVCVDDLTLAGGTKEIQQEFWKELQRRAKVEPEEFVSEIGTKILGITHLIQRTSKEVSMTYDIN